MSNIEIFAIVGALVLLEALYILNKKIVTKFDLVKYFCTFFIKLTCLACFFTLELLKIEYNFQVFMVLVITLIAPSMLGLIVDMFKKPKGTKLIFDIIGKLQK